MLRVNFDQLVIDLSEFYGRDDLPPEKKLNKWFEKMSRLPEETREFLYDRITDEYSRLPESLPKTAWKFFEEWRTEHPEKFKTREFNCTQEACYQGLIGFFMPPEGIGKMWSATRARCGHCDAYPKTAGVPTYTAQQIEANGWILEDYMGVLLIQEENDQLRMPYDPGKWALFGRQAGRMELLSETVGRLPIWKGQNGEQETRAT